MIIRQVSTLLLLFLLSAFAAAQDQKIEKIRALGQLGEEDEGRGEQRSPDVVGIGGETWIAFEESEGFDSRVRLVKLKTE